MYLSELLSDMHMSLPMLANMRPIELFEVNVVEIEEEEKEEVIERFPKFLALQ
jgi:hypothetical protein